MMDLIKYKWISLTTEERKWLSVSACFLLCFLLYIIIWAKFTHHLRQMEDDTADQQELLQWMRKNRPQLQRLRKEQPHNVTVNPNSLQANVAQSLKESALVTLVTVMAKITDDKIHIEFDCVSFDSLISWLNNVCEKNSLKVDQLVVKKISSPGDVQVNLVLGIN